MEEWNNPHFSFYLHFRIWLKPWVLFYFFFPFTHWLHVNTEKGRFCFLIAWRVIGKYLLIFLAPLFIFVYAFYKCLQWYKFVKKHCVLKLSYLKCQLQQHNFCSFSSLQRVFTRLPPPQLTATLREYIWEVFCYKEIIMKVSKHNQGTLKWGIELNMSVCLQTPGFQNWVQFKVHL